jgi:hypothetical protein
MTEPGDSVAFFKTYTWAPCGLAALPTDDAALPRSGKTMAVGGVSLRLTQPTDPDHTPCAA